MVKGGKSSKNKFDPFAAYDTKVKTSKHGRGMPEMPEYSIAHAKSQDTAGDDVPSNDSSTIFQYSAASTVDHDKGVSSFNSFDPFDAFDPTDFFSAGSVAASSFSDRQVVQAAIQEQLSILFDGASKSPACHVTGSIYLKPTRIKGNSMTLSVRDKKGQIENFEEKEEICENITEDFQHLMLEPSDCLLRVSMRDPEQLDSPIVRYTCTHRLRPIPLLVKNKIIANNDTCLVRIKIRANPGNKFVLERMAILMVVPPDIRGEGVTMSRKGGVWDGMKRTLSWPVASLEPGEILEIHCQFECIQDSSVPKPVFPILIRCDGRSIFSSVDLTTDLADQKSTAVAMNLSRSSRIIYRKV